MRSASTFLASLAILLSNICLPALGQAQYMYLDSNANGIHDSGDRLNPNGTATTVDIWLNTNVNRNGTTALCNVVPATTMSINAYAFNLVAAGGTVTYGSYINQQAAAFPNQAQELNPGDGVKYKNGFYSFSYAAAGLYRLGTLTITGIAGVPWISLVDKVAGSEDFTSFGTQCPGQAGDNTYRLNGANTQAFQGIADWNDGDGIREAGTWPYGGIAVAPDSLDQFLPSVAPDGAGGAIVAWQQGLPFFDIFAQKFNALGARQWGTNGVRLCSAANSQITLQAVPDASGGAILVWWDQRVSSWHVYCRRVNASGTPLWAANGVAIETAIDGDPYPTTIADGAGGAIIAWQDRRTAGVYHIYAQRVDSMGVAAWTTNGVAVVTASIGQGGAALTTDGVGGVIVAWSDGRTGAPGVYAQHLNSSGVAQWQTDGVLIWPGGNGVRLVPDGSGGAIVVFGASGDIYARRISSNGSLQWSSATSLCSATGTQALNSIASDGAGGAIVSWEDSRAGNKDVYAARIRSDGVAPWQTNGAAVCTAPNDQFVPTSVGDGYGGVLITWEDRRDEPTGGAQSGDIYMQRLNSNGSALWNHDGAVVAKEEYGQQAPTVASDGAGGAFAAWQDWRNEYDFKVFAMRMKPEGSHVTGVATVGHPTSASVLRQNYPNPFNPSTSIEFNLAEKGPATLRIYAVDGRLIRTLLKGAWPAGPHRVSWDGRTDLGGPTSTGVYLYRLETGRTKTARKMMLIR